MYPAFIVLYALYTLKDSIKKNYLNMDQHDEHNPFSSVHSRTMTNPFERARSIELHRYNFYTNRTQIEHNWASSNAFDEFSCVGTIYTPTEHRSNTNESVRTRRWIQLYRYDLHDVRSMNSVV